MVAFILPANSASSGGYEIDNSMRFNRGDAACLRKTFSGSPTSTKICTISFWTKLADPSNTDNKAIFSAIKSGINEDVIKFMGVNNGILNALELNFNNGNSGAMKVSSGNDTLIRFRDPSAWYHFVIAIDSSQGTASNRVKVYVNGTQFDVEARVEGGSITDDVVLTQDYELGFLTASAHSIGENVESAGNEPYDGYLADFHFVDGSQLAPTAFAETNDNGVWIPKDCKGDLTYGNYGFFLEFQQTGTSANASGKGADTSGNDNHFDDANATAEDITVDTPTNNFCTMSPIDTNGQASLSEGNTQLQRGSNYAGCNGTFGVANGKWYWEIKTPTPTASGENSSFGVTSIPHATIGNNYLATSGTTEWAIMIDNADSDILKIHNNSTTDYSVNASSNDIFQIALDMDNNKIYFGRNGTFFASGNPAGNSNEAYSSVSGNPFLFPAFSMNGDNTLQANFGNPPNSISSGNADANGYGNFEYAVPSGFYSLCTKNLAEYG